MRKFTRRFFATALTATLALSAAACGVPSVGSSEDDKKIDKSKEQIYVFNYDGGYKSAWLNAAAARYEALHANDTYNGKTGIQIMVTPVNGGVTAAGIKGGNYDIYSAEGIDYYSLVNSGALLDLTDVYTKDNPYETDKKVQDKLTASQEDYYNHEGKYYAIPNYAGFWGITYNIDLFEQKGFYIKDDADFADAENLDQYFTRNKNGRSAGPDGIPGTSDDGLPVTYDEFFYLCQIMLTRSVTPIIWSSKYYEKHLTGLTNALVAQAEGEEQMMLTYTMNGTATDLGKIVNGEFVEDADDTVITPSNGYEVQRRKGNYDALTFLNRLTNETYGNSNYYYKTSVESCFTGDITHTRAQEIFLQNGKINSENSIGMLVDGSWWESEATNVFATMAETNGEECAKANRNFGWMPLPKAEADDKGVTVSDSQYSLFVAKANMKEWKKDVVIDFLQFLNTDESLSEFSEITSTVKALNYTIDEDTLSTMSAYGQSIYNVKANGSVIYPISKNTVFVNSQSSFMDGSSGGGLYAALLGKDERTNPAVAFYSKHDSVESYFNGMYAALRNKPLWK